MSEIKQLVQDFLFVNLKTKRIKTSLLNHFSASIENLLLQTGTSCITLVFPFQSLL